MKIISSAAELSAFVTGKKVGTVYTMGALHAGHLALIRRCRELIGDDALLLVSIFVNPTQFTEADDLANYPRTPEADIQFCRSAGVDVLFTPTVTEIYPDAAVVPKFEVGELGDLLEGRTRPGHFSAVATVVRRLMEITNPAVTCFGEKDYQQLVVVKQMVASSGINCQVVGVETVRAENGVALSSRNARLSETGFKVAAVLYQSLQLVAKAIEAGVSVQTAVANAKAKLAEFAELELDYLEVTDAELNSSNLPIRGQSWQGRALIAAKIEGVRLIDNVAIALPDVTQVEK